MMSTSHGPSIPLYINSGQNDHHPAQFDEPYLASREIHSPGQFMWDSFAQRPSSPGMIGSLSYNENSIMPAQSDGTPYFSTEFDEDKDEFVTYGTYVSVRGGRSAYDPAKDQYYEPQNPENSREMNGNLPEIEAECEKELRNTMQHNPSATTPNVAQLVQEVEMLRKENLRLHEINETYEAKCYEHNMDNVSINGTGAGFDENDGDDDQMEEIIEEEVHTIKHSRPSTDIASTSGTLQTTTTTTNRNQLHQELANYVERQDEAVQSMSPKHRNASTGDWNTQQHYLIDLSTPVIDETQFPASYWSRLQDFFYNRFEANRPTTRELGVQTHEVSQRTTATMAVPSFGSSSERRCFGVSVSPVMESVGVMCPRVATREFGCTTIDSENVVRDWIENRLLGTNEATRKIVHQLFKSSMHSREEFLDTILRVVKRDSRHVGLQIKPEQRSQFAFTHGEHLVSTSVGESMPMDRTPTRPAESKMVEARPVLTNRSTLTRHTFGTSVACETEAPLMRTQGAQVSPEVPDVTACGIQVGESVHQVDRSLDPIFSHLRQTTTGQQMGSEAVETTVTMTQSSEEIERLWESRLNIDLKKSEQEHRSKTGSSTTTYQELPKSSNQNRTEVTDQHSAVHSTLMKSNFNETQPAVQKHTEKMVAESASSANAHHSTSIAGHIAESHRQSAPYRHSVTGSSESYTVSTERRMVDELSQRHLLNDVDLETLTHGSPEAIDALLANSKDLGTTHVIREFQPEVEVIHHIGDPLEFQLSVGPRIVTNSMVNADLRATTPSTTEPLGEGGVFHIPVIHSPITSRSEIRSIPVGRLIGPHPSTSARVDGIPTDHTVTESESVKVDQNKENKTRLSDRTGEQFKMDEWYNRHSSENTCQITREVRTVTEGKPMTLRHKVCIPVRNHSYIMSAEVTKACQILSELYKKGVQVDQNVSSSEELESLRTIWFNLTNATNIEVEKLEDFMAILYGYHEDLLRNVLQSVDDNGSTSLHYAVGHGAWSVVNLILDSGCAEPDRLNSVGFSPIMISTVCNVSNEAALSTLSRLFSAGNVNARARTTTRQTPLMLAAVHGSKEIVELLLQHGARVNLQDTSGNTALMFAIEHGHLVVIQTLLERPDLDLSLKDNDGKDALAIAESLGNTDVTDMIKHVLAGYPPRSSFHETSTTTTTATKH